MCGCFNSAQPKQTCLSGELNWGNDSYTYGSFHSARLMRACLYPVAAFKTFLLLLCVHPPTNNHTKVSCAWGAMGQLFISVRHDTWTCLTAQFSETRTIFHQTDMFRLTCLWECVSPVHPRVRNMCEFHNVKVINQHHGPDLTLHAWTSLACWRAGGRGHTYC